MGSSSPSYKLKLRPMLVVVSVVMVLLLIYVWMRNSPPPILSKIKCWMIEPTTGDLKNAHNDLLHYSIKEVPKCPKATAADLWNTDKGVVVRSVYPHSRAWDGHPSSYIFMAEVDNKILSRGSFVKCEVGQQNSTSLDYIVPHLATEANGWCRNRLTHQTVMVRCYLPLDSKNGSQARLFYKTNPQSPIKVAESEKPLRIPDPPVSSESHPTIVSCIAVQYGQPPFLAEWVRYQRSIGVSHIQMIAEPSILQSGALNHSSVKKALEEGFLSVDIWPKWFSASQIYDHSQLLAYDDCLYRFQGTYDFLFPHDADDFFVPVQSDQRKLQYYINKYCSNAGSCVLGWYQMCPSCGVVRETAEDGNVTDTLASFDRCYKLTKALHNLPVTYDVGTHDGYRWAPGYGRVVVPETAMYVAHVRLTAQ